MANVITEIKIVTRPVINMPLLRPIPIPTKGLSYWKKFWLMLTVTRKWELADNWFFRMPDGTWVMIPRGFIMDGASTPKFIWGILDPVGILLLQGIIHDHGYRFDYLWAFDENRGLHKLYKNSGRKFWDDKFLEIGNDLLDMQVTGKISWLMLRWFGGRAWRENRKLNQADILITY